MKAALDVDVAVDAQAYDIGTLISTVLGGLVGVTAGCAVFTPAESILMGCAGALTAVAVDPIMHKCVFIHVSCPYSSCVQTQGR